jgi:hypothetical protein
LKRLIDAGFELPELLPLDTKPGRKLGGMRPWAWSPDAVERLRPFASDVAAGLPNGFREAVPAKWFSKEIGLEMEHALGPVPETGTLHRDAVSALTEIFRLLESGQALLKAPFACAGRGHLRVNHESIPDKTRGWIDNTLAAHGSVVIEPWLDRVLDFSALYEMKPGGEVSLLNLTRIENDAAGRFLGIRIGPKWGNLLEPEVAEFLFRQADVLRIYQETIPAALGKLLTGYTGPLCVDAMVHRRGDGSLAFKPVVELNVRMTMGRIAYEWARRGPDRGGCLKILRKQSTGDDEITALTKGPGLFLNDPAAATTFLAYWTP